MNLLFLPWPWAYGPLQSESAVELSLWGPWENLCGQGCPGEDGQSFCIWKAAWRFWKRSRNEWDGGMKGNEVCFTSTHAYIDIHTICTELFSIFAMLPSDAMEEACKWPSIRSWTFLFRGSNVRFKNWLRLGLHLRWYVMRASSAMLQRNLDHRKDLECVAPSPVIPWRCGGMGWVLLDRTGLPADEKRDLFGLTRLQKLAPSVNVSLRWKGSFLLNIFNMIQHGNVSNLIHISQLSPIISVISVKISLFLDDRGRAMTPMTG